MILTCFHSKQKRIFWWLENETCIGSCSFCKVNFVHLKFNIEINIIKRKTPLKSIIKT